MAKNNNPGKILKGTKTDPTLKSASGVWTLDEAMQLHRANAWPQPNLFQPVSNSLRFKSSSSATMIRNVVRSGNPTAFTQSFWVKRTGVTVGLHIGQAYHSGSHHAGIYVDPASGVLYLFIYYNGSAWQGQLYTDAVFRDPSAWYHIFLAVDTNLSTASDRIKLYVNGVQLTSFSTANYPNRGQSTLWNIASGGSPTGSGGVYGINSSQGASATNYSDTITSEMHWIDGYGLQPTLFGKFDSNNNWVPIPYTGSYGTTGFYLPFTNATTSQTLGYDASLNGTPTYTVDQDPYRGHVALHLTGNGPAGGNNKVFSDSSDNNFTIALGGSASFAPTQGSFSPFNFETNTPYNSAVHGASGYFIGTDNGANGGWIQAANNTAFDMTGVPYCFETWVYNANPGKEQSLFNRFDGVSGPGLSIGILAANTVLFFTGTNIISTSTVPGNQWVHLACTYDGSTKRIFINGVLDATVQSSGTFWQNSVTNTQMAIGARPSDSRYFYLNGYLSGTRIIKGNAVYTSTFSPMRKPMSRIVNNLVNFSEDFTSFRWGANTNVNVSTGATVAPDRTPSASLVTCTSTAASYIRQDSLYNMGTSTVYTLSAYVKAATSNIATISDGFGTGANVTYNLTTQAQTAISGGGYGTPTSTITDVGNGWYRISLTFTTQPSNNYQIGSRVDPGRTYGGTGNVGDSIYVWGVQLDSGSTMNIYSPTPSNFVGNGSISLLLNFANAAVVDSTGANDIITSGTATISSANKYGSGALTNAGTTGYWQTAGNPLNGAGDFTIEGWWNTSSFATTGYFLRLFSIGTGLANHITLNVDTSGFIIFRINDAIQFTSSTALTLNAWTHIAFVRQGLVYRLFINGQQTAVVNLTTSVASQLNNPVYIGSESDGGGGYLNGSIDDFRITKGIARYVSAFTPPARALPETGGKSFVVQNINAGVVQRFTTVGTTAWTAPSDVTQVEVLVVAGGGGTGHSEYHNGGGGGGGLIYNNSYPVVPGQTYTVTVGAGGTGGTSNSSGNQTAGGNSIFGSLTALGGGKGGSHSTYPGGNGGSGGGGAENGGAGSRVAGTGTPGQGFAGAVGFNGGQGAGGGGGAGGPGEVGVNNSRGGNGGPGLQFGISGTPTYYAGGGGGANYYGNTTSSGGLGGGGIGWWNNVSGGSNGAAGSSNGTPNTGGGAGGYERADLRAGAVGGSGIVLIRYTTTAVGNSSDATTDNLVDSPTLYGHDMGLGGEVVGTYCTINPLNGASSTVVSSNGNLTVTWGNSQSNATIGSTMPVNSGRWYFEATLTTVGGNFPFVGIIPAQNVVGSSTSEAGYTNTIWVGNGQLAAGDVVGFAFNLDTLVASVYKNGVALSTGSAWNTSAIASGQGYWMPAVSGLTGTVWNLNFGQRAWAYAPPAGYNALTTKNFDRLTGAAAAPNQYFDTVLYTGTASSQTITLPGAFQPDLVWFKNRGVSQNHHLMDVNRGGGTILYANLTNTEDALGTSWANFTSTGFSLGASAGVNTSTHTYVAWCWRAGGAAVSNTSGTIASQVSANTTSGFSVVTYTGTGVAGTVGHGQTTTAPRFILIKQRNVTVRSWPVYHAGLADPQSALYLDSVAGAFAYTGFFNSVAPTNLNFSLGTDATVNQSGSNYVAYVWSPVPGFSAFGSYTGNGAANGPFVYTGFKPRWVMWRRADSTGSAWFIYDTARSIFNPMGIELYASDPGIEASTTRMDFLSNGFKLRAANGGDNASTVPYIYAAFADKPFGNANGTAR